MGEPSRKKRAEVAMVTTMVDKYRSPLGKTP